MPPEFEIATRSVWWRIGFLVLGVGLMLYGGMGALDGRITVGLGRGGTGYPLVGAAAYLASAGAVALGAFSTYVGALNRMPPRPLGVAGALGLLAYFLTALVALVVHHAG